MPDKDRECHYLTLLRRCVELPPQEAAGPEPPDFLLGEPPNRVGIELTEYHHPADDGGPSFQAIQSMKWRILERAEEIYSASGGAALYLTAIFGRHGRLTKTTVPRIAQQLAKAVLAVRVPSSMHEDSVHIPRNLLPDEIVNAWVHASVDGIGRLWKPDHTGRVAKVSPEHVQAELDRKQRVVASARQHCDALWLVLVHNLTRGAPCDLSDAAATAKYLSAFDRVVDGSARASPT